MDSKKNMKWEFIGLTNFREIYKGLILLFKARICDVCLVK